MIYRFLVQNNKHVESLSVYLNLSQA